MSEGTRQGTPFGSNHVQALLRTAEHMRQLEVFAEQWSQGPEQFWRFEEVLTMLSRDVCRGFVAVQEGHAQDAHHAQKWQGIVFADVATFSADLLYIYVTPEERSKGVAKRLLRGLLDSLAQEPCVEQLILEVRPSNHAAIELYRSHQFNLVGTRKRYYSDGEDALVMALNLMGARHG